ncbi:MAG TPA: hypothetical protein VIM30_18580 [Candidatus Limnocylindrales bacterium]
MADLRKCIGSAKFGIEAHDAPATDFPVQPSQRDGLGRMCKAHWNQYTTALRKAALARKADPALLDLPLGAGVPKPEGPEPTVQSQAAARVATKRAARLHLDPATGATVLTPDPLTGESPAVTKRRAKLDATLTEVGVGTDAGQAILEAGDTPMGIEDDLAGAQEASIA